MGENNKRFFVGNGLRMLYSYWNGCYLLVWVLLVADAAVAWTTMRRSVRRIQPLHVVSKDPTTGKPQFMVLNATEDAILRSEGDAEAALMENNAGPLLPLDSNIIQKKKSRAKKGSAAMGFGSARPAAKGKKQKTGNTRPVGRTDPSSISEPHEDESLLESSRILAYAEALHKDGIVRIDNVLTDLLADNLKNYLVDLRDRSRASIESAVLLDSQERFADVLLNRNRCDLKIPLGPPPVTEALHHVLHNTPLRRLMEHVFDSYVTTGPGGSTGSAATLYELNCFMSQAGALRQLVHADNVCVTPGVLHEDEPVMLTLFIALQDIDLDMGPTTWLLGTHNRAAHQDFYANSDEEKIGNTPATILTEKAGLLRNRQKVIGTLPRGSCAIFDPRTLHCAGANTCADANATRALFYVSFKNPRVDYPGCPSCSGYGIVDAELTLLELCRGLDARMTGGISTRLDFLSCFP